MHWQLTCTVDLLSLEVRCCSQLHAFTACLLQFLLLCRFHFFHSLLASSFDDRHQTVVSKWNVHVDSKNKNNGNSFNTMEQAGIKVRRWAFDIREDPIDVIAEWGQDAVLTKGTYKRLRPRLCQILCALAYHSNLQEYTHTHNGTYVYDLIQCLWQPYLVAYWRRPLIQ